MGNLCNQYIDCLFIARYLFVLLPFISDSAFVFSTELICPFFVYPEHFVFGVLGGQAKTKTMGPFDGIIDRVFWFWTFL
jgi:hypothetical protein